MSELDRARRAWLALEREAVWLYPFLGARVPALAAQAREALADHRATRDRLVAAVSTSDDDDATGVTAAYEVGPIESVDQARAAAQDLERRVQAACLTVFAASEPGDRGRALQDLRAAAAAEIAWGGQARAFPGLQ